MAIRIPDEKHERLKRLAVQRGISLNKLFEDWSTAALTGFDAENRFRALTARGNPRRALALLDKLDTICAKMTSSAGTRPRTAE